jgi:hypothetical protein
MICKILFITLSLYLNDGNALRLQRYIKMGPHGLRSDSTVEILRKAFGRNKIPGIDSLLVVEKNKNTSNINFGIDTDINFRTDFFKCKGDEIYNRIVDKRSQYLLSQLTNASIGVMNIAQLSQEKVVVHWNVTFIPETVAFLNFMGNSMVDRIIYKTLLSIILL